MTSASLWVQGARPRTLGAAVAPGARRHVGRGGGGRRRDLVARRVGDGGRARAAGRRQLRQRLLRRRARHRQGPQGPGAAHRDRARDAGRGEARRVPRVRRGRGRGPGALARRRTRGCCWSASPPSPRPGSTPAARSRTATSGSASSWCSCSSGSWRRSAPAYVQIEEVPGAAWWGSLVVGLLACAILVANNVRDIPTDAVTGKRTLAVRVGATAARRLFVACYVGSFLAVVAIGIIATLGAPRPARAAARGRAGAHDPDPHRSTVAGRGAGADVEARSSWSRCW